MAAEHPLSALPEKLTDRVAIDEKKGVVYVDQLGSGNPLLNSWIARNRSNGWNLKMEIVPFDELAAKRANGMRQSANDDEEDVQKFRQNAIDTILRAAEYGSSDMHLMVRSGYSEIQIVVKGGLRVLERGTQENGARLARAIYQGLAKTRDSSYSALDFQNAQIPGGELPQDAELTSVRIIRGPCYPQAESGEFMTLRLQYSGVRVGGKKADLPPLDVPRRPKGQARLAEMGFSDRQIEKLRMLMDAPNGVILVTGPTGSGKTTLMKECLEDIARVKPHRRLVTIEDPVEYPMDWAVQIPVTDARNEQDTGAAFNERLRVALRMAPHIILLGELRGPDVAAAALDAALTGHQVWSTLHVTDPFMFVDRLELMDKTRLDRKVFCDHKIVRGVLAVRLLPKLCPHCSEPLNEESTSLPHRVVHALKTWGSISKVRLQGAGCSECGGDGTTGRFSVAEIVVTDQQLMSDMIEHGSAEARSKYRARPDADPSMIAAAITHALNGNVDPRAIEEWVDLIEEKVQA